MFLRSDRRSLARNSYSMLTSEDRYWILKRLAKNPDASQRELAEELGVSLGTLNYCLKALTEKGLLKVKNFRTSKNKRAYLYYLIPEGGEEQARVTIQYLRRKMAEYESLKSEIEQLKLEAQSHSLESPFGVEPGSRTKP